MIEVGRDDPDPIFLFSVDKYRLLFTAAMEIAKYGVTPTIEEFSYWMERHANKGMDAERIRNIVEEARGPEGLHFGVPHTLMLLKTILDSKAKERKARFALDEAQEILEAGAGTIEDRLSEATALIQESTPSSISITALTGDAMAKSHQETLKRRKDEMARGLIPITLPISWGLGEYVPRLADGEMSLIMGPTGTFKSTLCLSLCLANAERGNGKIKVAYYHAENLPQNVQDRMACQWLEVPIEELRRGEHAQAIEKAWADRPWMANFSAIHCPGVTPETIVEDMSRRAFRLDEDEVLLAVIDYLDGDKLDLSRYKRDNDAYRLGAASGAFKNAAERFSRKARRGFKGGVHVFVATQQNDDNKSYGSKKPMFQSQLVMRIEAKKVEETMPFSIGNGETITLKAGEKAPIIRLFVEKGNDVRNGYSTVLIRPQWYKVAGPVRDANYDNINSGFGG